MRQSPERELLKLIEESKSSKTSQVDLSIEAKKRIRGSLFSPKAWKARSLFFVNRIIKWLKDVKTRPLELKNLNRILELSLAILIVFFINGLISFAQINQRTIDLKFKPKYIKDSFLETDTLHAPPLSSYLEKISQRDIFNMISKKEEKDILPSSKAIEAVQHLKLVGISWSNDPDAMIEDTRAMRTFFVKKGQFLGEIKIEEIYKDKVILSYGGERIELK